MRAAEWFVTLLTAYAATGIAFGILFVAAGVHRVGAAAKGRRGVSHMILPGLAVLWTALLLRWVRHS